MSLQGQHSFPQRRTYGPGFVTEAWGFHPGLKGEVMSVKDSPTVKVKALIWKKDWRGDLDDIPVWHAETPFGRLLVSAHGYASHDAAPAEKTEAAKVAIQADYEKRVLSCLEIETPEATS